MNEELMPFEDPQARKPAARCLRCGREIYGQQGQCIYCLRELP